MVECHPVPFTMVIMSMSNKIIKVQITDRSLVPRNTISLVQFIQWETFKMDINHKQQEKNSKYLEIWAVTMKCIWPQELMTKLSQLAIFSKFSLIMKVKFSNPLSPRYIRDQIKTHNKRSKVMSLTRMTLRSHKCYNRFLIPNKSSLFSD